MSSPRLQNTFFLGLLVLVTLTFFWLLQDFWLPIFWAAVLATLFHPLFQDCTRCCGGRAALGAVLTITLILLLVILPLLLTGFAVAAEVSGIYERVAAGDINPQVVVDWIDRNVPLATDFLSGLGLSVDQLRSRLSGAAVATSRFLASKAVGFGQDALRIGGLTFLMLYLLFFFLRDGRILLNTIVSALPIGDARERRLLHKFAEVSRATIKGTIVIGVVQGGIGGLLFWALGIDGAVLWGVVMGLLSLLPAVGAAVVWIPAAAFLMVSGAPVKGLILLLGGSTLIGLADNVIRPLLVGRDTGMPDYLILVSTLGGLTLFGLSGVVIGPVLAALFVTVWEMFADEYADVANDSGREAPLSMREQDPASS
ncbi:MAG: AI-2E family transporter [Bacteroidetes bacterium SW_9_63_38]|nr:MAG: AI-2E family transporter [Bacteroidetes bacterium SW_9_63_38]